MESKDSKGNQEVDPAIEIMSDDEGKESQPSGRNAPKKDEALEEEKADRLQYSREELLNQIVEVQQIPGDLLKNLANNQKLNRKGPHVISLYPLKPVASQDEPFQQYHNRLYQERYAQRQKHSNYTRGDNENRKNGQRDPNNTNDPENAPNNHGSENSPGKSSDQQQQQFLKIPLHLSIEEQMEFLKNLQNQGAKSNDQNQDDKKEESKSQAVNDEIVNKAQTQVDKAEKGQETKAKVRAGTSLDEENRQVKQNRQRPIQDAEANAAGNQEKNKVKNGKAEVKLDEIVVEVGQAPPESTVNARKPATNATPIAARNREKALDKPQEKPKEVEKELQNDQMTSKQTPRQSGSDKRQNRAKENAPKMVYQVKQSPQKVEQSPEVDAKEDVPAEKQDKRTQRSQNWKNQEEKANQEQAEAPEEEAKVEEKVQEEVAAEVSQGVPHSPADGADPIEELDQPDEDADYVGELAQGHQSTEDQQLQKLTKSQRRKMNRRKQLESQPAAQPKNLYKSQQVLNNKDKPAKVDASDNYYYDPHAANNIYVDYGEEGQDSYEVTNINAQGSNFKTKYADHAAIKERQAAKGTKKEAKPAEKIIRIVDNPKDDQKQKAAIAKKKEESKPKQPIVNKYKVDESKSKDSVKVDDMDQILNQQQNEEQKIREYLARKAREAKLKAQPENPDDIKSIFNAAARVNNGQKSYVAPVLRDEIEEARKKKGFYAEEAVDPKRPDVKFDKYGMAVQTEEQKQAKVDNKKEQKQQASNLKKQLASQKLENQIKAAQEKSENQVQQQNGEESKANTAKYEKKLKKKKKKQQMGSDYSSSDCDDDINLLPKHLQKPSKASAKTASKADQKGKKQQSNLLGLFNEKSIKQKIKMAQMDIV